MPLTRKVWVENGRAKFRAYVESLLDQMDKEQWEASDTLDIMFDNFCVKQCLKELYTYGRNKDEVSRVYETRIDCCNR